MVIAPPEGTRTTMTRDRNAFAAIKEAFERRFQDFPGGRLPAENVRERKGSRPYVHGGRLPYDFGEEDGREYLDNHACHRMGESHGRIRDDGTLASLPPIPGPAATPTSPGAGNARTRR